MSPITKASRLAFVFVCALFLVSGMLLLLNGESRPAQAAPAGAMIEDAARVRERMMLS